ncbi:MAG: hypothetical protein M1598_06745, partial [Actinobacteria bacterium]|nr:hypothetical protein [Actinomycetota bacterium]
MKYLAACVQYEPAIFEKEKNTAALIGFVEQAASKGARLVVMPEMATTGYCFQGRDEISAVVEPLPGRTSERFAAAARKHRLHLVLGLAEVDPGTGIYYNTAVLIGPGGEIIGKYRKTHSFIDETRWAKDGDLGIPVFETDIGRIAMLVCMDAMYFEPARVAALKGADVIALPTNWLGGQRPWYARALENGVYLLAADRWGEERGTRFAGNSTIIDPEGKAAAKFPQGDGVILAEIDLEKARLKAYPGIGDRLGERRPGEYHGVVINSHLWGIPTAVAGLSQKESWVAVAQFEPVPGNAEANLAKMEALVDSALAEASGRGVKLDLVVFPELAPTGPVSGEEMRGLADPIPGKVTRWAADLAGRAGAYLVLGLAEAEGDRLYNSAVIAAPGEICGLYRKVHLNESDRGWATPGDLGFPTFDLPLGRAGLLIGSDLFFPESARCLAKAGCDLVCVPSAWPWSEGVFLWDERAQANNLHLA